MCRALPGRPPPSGWERNRASGKEDEASAACARRSNAPEGRRRYSWGSLRRGLGEAVLPTAAVKGRFRRPVYGHLLFPLRGLLLELLRALRGPFLSAGLDLDRELVFPRLVQGDVRAQEHLHPPQG